MKKEISDSYSNTNRILYIDIYRGIGILLMILDHIGCGHTFYKLIHSFHMPMFFFIAGYCYKECPFYEYGERIRKKARTLLIPYFFFGITEYILWLLTIGEGTEPLKHLFWENTDGLAVAGALWFLTAFYISSIVYMYINLIQNTLVINILVILMSLAGCILPRFMNNRLPYGIDAALVGVGFCHTGHIFKTSIMPRLIGMRNNVLFVGTIACGILCLPIVMCNGAVNMRTGTYSNIGLFWIGALLACIVLLRVSKTIEERACSLFSDALAYVGRNAIVYVCLNQLIIAVVNRLIGDNINRIVYVIAQIIIVMSVLYIIVRVLNIYPFSCLLGKEPFLKKKNKSGIIK